MRFSVEKPDIELVGAIDRGQFGFALVDETLAVALRRGALSRWLPPEGEPACASALLLHMEDALRALRAGNDEIVLPSMRAPERELGRITISIAWDGASRRYVIITTPDHGGDQTERLLASERREKLLLQQQTDAARARLRVADTLYRDIVEGAGDLVLRFGVDRRIVFANGRAALFLGVPQDALLNRIIDNLFPPPRLGDAGESPWRVHSDRPASFEMATRDARGAPIWIWWDARFFEAESGGEFQAIGRDITEVRRLRVERDRAREEARAADLASQRLRIAHDLHDTLARSIVTLILEMGLVAKTTADPAAREKLVGLQARARAGLAEAREAITQLRAIRREESDPRQIVEAFEKRARATERVALRANLALDASSLPTELADNLNRVLREALRNIELHARARNVDIDLRRDGDAVRLDIVDDGLGFDPAAPPVGHFGLIGMRERAAAIGATLEITSAPGKGARLSLRAPIPATETPT